MDMKNKFFFLSVVAFCSFTNLYASNIKDASSRSRTSLRAGLVDDVDCGGDFNPAALVQSPTTQNAARSMHQQSPERKETLYVNPEFAQAYKDFLDSGSRVFGPLEDSVFVEEALGGVEVANARAAVAIVARQQAAHHQAVHRVTPVPFVTHNHYNGNPLDLFGHSSHSSRNGTPDSQRGDDQGRNVVPAAVAWTTLAPFGAVNVRSVMAEQAHVNDLSEWTVSSGSQQVQTNAVSDSCWQRFVDCVCCSQSQQ